MVAPVAPDFMALSRSSHPNLTVLAILGTRTATSLSPIVRLLTPMSLAMSIWVFFLNSIPLPVRRMPLLPMVMSPCSWSREITVLALPSPIPRASASFFLPMASLLSRISRAFHRW